MKQRARSDDDRRRRGTPPSGSAQRDLGRAPAGRALPLLRARGSHLLTEASSTDARRSRLARRPALSSRCALAAFATLIAAIALLGGVALLAAPSAGGSTISNGVFSFLSAPTLAAPAIEVPHPEDSTAASVGSSSQKSYVLLAPIRAFSIKAPFVGKPGPEILEANGNLVWQDPLGELVQVGSAHRQTVAMDLHTSTYQGKPVLVFWQGQITPQGFGNGSWEIVNQHYQTVATISAPPGYELDFHDIQLTSNGRAYILGNKVVKLSLGCCGGPKNGSLYDQVVFEVEVETGKIVWQWDPLHQVPLKESYTTPQPNRIWDPYHLNSVSLGPSGNLVISARNTWAAYWANRVKPPYEGKVFATLGGKRSSFQVEPDAHFAWQHDVEQHARGGVTIFDDEAAPAEGPQSKGLLLRLNFKQHTAKLIHEYLLPEEKLAGSQGSVQLQGDGRVFVGWGQLPYFSEYTDAGELLYEGNLPGSDESYRAYRSPWIGLPLTHPSIFVQAAGAGSAAGGTQVYASWNGATQIVSWRVLAGSSPTSLAPVGEPVQRTGFETEITTSSPGPYYEVQAIDRAGKVLGSSEPSTASTSTTQTTSGTTTQTPSSSTTQTTSGSTTQTTSGSTTQTTSGSAY